MHLRSCQLLEFRLFPSCAKFSGSDFLALVLVEHPHAWQKSVPSVDGEGCMHIGDDTTDMLLCNTYSARIRTV